MNSKKFALIGAIGLSLESLSACKVENRIVSPSEKTEDTQKTSGETRKKVNKLKLDQVITEFGACLRDIPIGTPGFSEPQEQLQGLQGGFESKSYHRTLFFGDEHVGMRQDLIQSQGEWIAGASTDFEVMGYNDRESLIRKAREICLERRAQIQAVRN